MGNSTSATLLFGIRIALVRLRFAGLVVAIGLTVAYWDKILAGADRLFRPATAASGARAGDHYCPMHPNVVRGEPGACAICGMPLARRSGAVEPAPADALARVVLSPYRVRLAGLETVAVERRPLERTLETIGIVQFDELRLARVAARLKGRVTRLFIPFAGPRVRRGDPLLSIFSQDFFQASQEVVFAKTVGGPAFESLRERLKLLGPGDAQVARILEQGKAESQVDIVAPIDGTIVEKKVLATDFVQEGTEMFTIADTSWVWVSVRISEDEVPLVHVGDRVVLRAASLPGLELSGRVWLIDPALSLETRTLQARVEVRNDKGLLKPGMYLTAELRIPIGPNGLPAPGFKPARETSIERARTVYTCSMHPHIAERGPGVCALCGMKLVAREPSDGARGGALPLAIPVSTVIDTGGRQVVYRESAPGTFDAVAVTLGPRAGDFYPVVAGISDGERLVARGAFLIDAEARLSPAGFAAAPSADRPRR